MEVTACARMVELLTGEVGVDEVDDERDVVVLVLGRFVGCAGVNRLRLGSLQ